MHGRDKAAIDRVGAVDSVAGVAADAGPTRDGDRAIATLRAGRHGARRRNPAATSPTAGRAHQRGHPRKRHRAIWPVAVRAQGGGDFDAVEVEVGDVAVARWRTLMPPP
eukprot:5936256-Pyramimonas_sp.AAC.1